MGPFLYAKKLGVNAGSVIGFKNIIIDPYELRTTKT
jgi:hypothetical protein